MKSEEIIKILKLNEKRITKAKLEMIEIFLETDDFINAIELREKLTNKPDISTVYRNLDSFCEMGFLEKMQKDDKRWYKIKEDYSKHAHYILCEDCGKKRVLDFCPIILTDSKVEGYEITGHKFELTGICNDCNKKEVKNAEKRKNNK